MIHVLFRCIDNLVSVLAPLIKGLQEMTGLQLLVLAGGCIPAKGGDIGAML